jgi:hypothetical protein
MPVSWGAATASERGPIIPGPADTMGRNALGAHHGGLSVYRAVAVASGTLDAAHIPDLTDTAPTDIIGPHPRWANPQALVSIDDTEGILRLGLHGQAKIHVPWQTLGGRFGRYLAHTFNFEL